MIGKGKGVNWWLVKEFAAVENKILSFLNFARVRKLEMFECLTRNKTHTLINMAFFFLLHFESLAHVMPSCAQSQGPPHILAKVFTFMTSQHCNSQYERTTWSIWTSSSPSCLLHWIKIWPHDHLPPGSRNNDSFRQAYYAVSEPSICVWPDAF